MKNLLKYTLAIAIFITSQQIIIGAQEHQKMANKCAELFVNRAICLVTANKEDAKKIDMQIMQIATSKEIVSLYKSMSRKSKMAALTHNPKSVISELQKMKPFLDSLEKNLAAVDIEKLAKKHNLTDAQKEELSDYIQFVRLFSKILSTHLIKYA